MATAVLPSASRPGVAPISANGASGLGSDLEAALALAFTPAQLFASAFDHPGHARPRLPGRAVVMGIVVRVARIVPVRR
jgi:hypothetical protein